MEKIDAWQVFWSLLTILVSYIAIMITLFRRELREVKLDTDKRVLIISCDKYREGCQKDCAKSREQRDKFIERIYQDADESCEKVREQFSRTSHTHATVGSAGEVVK